MFFFFNDTATTEIYTLSLHDALPISRQSVLELPMPRDVQVRAMRLLPNGDLVLAGTRDGPLTHTEPSMTHNDGFWRSEEHTSELQSLRHLVCRLLLVKKKTKSHVS